MGGEILEWKNSIRLKVKQILFSLSSSSSSDDNDEFFFGSDSSSFSFFSHMNLDAIPLKAVKF